MSDFSATKKWVGDSRGGRNTSKRGWIAVLIVAAAAAAIIFYKETGNRPSFGPVARALQASTASGGPAEAVARSVLLFADAGEAESACGCGQIIRLVREAGARGVVVREVAPGSDASLEREYRVTVAPTVLMLDSKGRVVARHEGEGPEAIEAIRSGLEQLSKARR